MIRTCRRVLQFCIFTTGGSIIRKLLKASLIKVYLLLFKLRLLYISYRLDWIQITDGSARKKPVLVDFYSVYQKDLCYWTDKAYKSATLRHFFNVIEWPDFSSLGWNNSAYFLIRVFIIWYPPTFRHNKPNHSTNLKLKRAILPFANSTVSLKNTEKKTSNWFNRACRGCLRSRSAAAQHWRTCSELKNNKSPLIGCLKFSIEPLSWILGTSSPFAGDPKRFPSSPLVAFTRVIIQGAAEGQFANFYWEVWFWMGIWEDGGASVEFRFKWIALCVVVSNPKYYNTSADDLRFIAALDSCSR